MTPELRPDACELAHSLPGHTGAVLGLRWTKNGRYVMSASQDKSLRLWNPHTGAHVKTYKGPHNHEVTDVIISEDNSKFLSCGGDKQFFQWDVTTGQVIRKFMGHDRKLNALAYGPNQDVVLTASHDKSVRLWDLRARARGSIQVLSEATDSVLCVTVNGDEIVTGSTDGDLRRYDVRKGQLVADHLLQPVGSVSFSKDAECMLVSTLDHTIRLLERSTGNVLATYKDHVNQRFKVQSTLDPSDAFVVSGSEDNRVCMWDLADGKLVCSLRGHGGPVLCAAFHQETLVTAAGDGEVKVWKAAEVPLSAAQAMEAIGPADAGLPAAFGRGPVGPPGRPLAPVGTASTLASPAFAVTALAPAATARVAPDIAMPGSVAEGPAGTVAPDSATAAAAASGEPPPAKRARGDRGRKTKRKSSDA